jgi:hypothetical protein
MLYIENNPWIILYRKDAPGKKTEQPLQRYEEKGSENSIQA